MNEVEVIAKVNKGATSEFETLVQKYQGRIYTLCRYLLKSPQDAEDAAQDTFLKAFQGLKGFTPTSAFYTWLYRIAVNTCLDYRRKSSLRSVFSSADIRKKPDLVPSELSSPESTYAAKESIHALQAALNSISEKLRIVVVLKEMEGLSYEEIAKILDVSVGTVKSRISRAREELRKRMEEFTEQK
jgi:RNA polymerase sigma-70 factor (ECF subfamily)